MRLTGFTPQDCGFRLGGLLADRVPLDIFRIGVWKMKFYGLCYRVII